LRIGASFGSFPWKDGTWKAMSERLTLKEMCARFDVTPRTLRHYEYIELLFPDKEGRTRFYGPREIARLKLILRGRRFGFSLEDVRQWLLLYDEDPQNLLQLTTFVDMANQQLDELHNRLAELNEVIADLNNLRDVAQGEIEALHKTE